MSPPSLHFPICNVESLVPSGLLHVAAVECDNGPEHALLSIQTEGRRDFAFIKLPTVCQTLCPAVEPHGRLLSQGRRKRLREAV